MDTEDLSRKCPYHIIPVHISHGMKVVDSEGQFTHDECTLGHTQSVVVVLKQGQQVTASMEIHQ